MFRGFRGFSGLGFRFGGSVFRVFRVMQGSKGLACTEQELLKDSVRAHMGPKGVLRILARVLPGSYIGLQVYKGLHDLLGL